MPESQSASLKKGSLNLFGVTMTALGQIAPLFSIGFTFGVIAGITGQGVPLVFFLAFIGILATSNSLACFSEKWPSAGSYISFIGRAISPSVALTVFALAVVAEILLNAGIYEYMGGFILNQIFHHPTDSFGLTMVTIIVYATICTVPVMVGVIVGVRTAVAMYLFELAIISIVVVAILVSGGDHGLSTEPLKVPSGGFQSVGLAVAIAVIAFLGFDAAAPMAEEAKDPRRSIPRALYLTAFITAVIYIVCAYAISSAFKTPADLAGNASPLVAAAHRFASPVAILVKWAFLSSATAGFIGASTQISRWMYNTARAELAPPSWAKIHRRFRTPVNAIFWLNAIPVLICCIALVVTSLAIGNVFLASWGAIGMVLAFLVTNLALITQYIRDRRAGARMPFARHVIAPLCGVVVLGTTVYFNLKTDQPSPEKYFILIIPATILAAVGYTMFVRSRRPTLLKSPDALFQELMDDSVVAPESPLHDAVSVK